MRHRCHQAAVLQHGAAAHALDDAAGPIPQLRIGDDDHGVQAVPVLVQAGDLRPVLPGLPAADRGENGGRAQLDRPGLHQTAAQGRRQMAIDAVVGVFLHAAQHPAHITAAVELAGGARRAAHHVHDLRLRDAATAHGQALPALFIADAVAQRAVGAGGRVTEGDGPDTGDSVPQPHAQHPLLLPGEDRRDADAQALLLPQKAQLRALALQLAHGGDQFRGAVHLPAVHGDDKISLPDAGLPGRSTAALRRLHLADARHQHTPGADLNAHDLSAQGQLLGEGQAGQRNEQAQGKACRN